jgi:Uma2 family endonuclease
VAVRHRFRKFDDAKMARMSTSLVSYADLQHRPDDGRQYELYDGEVRVVPSPTNRHQFVLLNLVAVLMEYEQRHGGRLLFAPSDVVFTQYNVVQPDVLYFSEARRHLVQLDTPTNAAPDLTVEVVSPGTSSHDRVRKQATYARFGVREYWIVDPFDETIEVFSLEGSVYRAASITRSTGVAVSPGIPGLRVAAARIFDLS